MAGEASRNNGRKGGRPKGRKDTATLEREAVLKEYRVRVGQQAQRLLDAELAVALGCSFLFRKPKSPANAKAERVTDPETIQRFLNGELEGDEQDWYFVTVEKPDTQTIRGMFDRLWDKPGQRHEVTGPDGGPQEHRVIFEEVVSGG